MKDPLLGTWSPINSDYSTGIYLTYTHTSTSNFLAGMIYSFRVRPKNNIGFSLSTSVSLDVLSDTYPDALVTLTQESVEPKSITISWTALPTANNGRDFIIFYGVELKNPTTGSWSQLNSDFSSGPYQTYTHISATTFLANTIYSFRIKPKNGVGYSLSGSA